MSIFTSFGCSGWGRGASIVKYLALCDHSHCPAGSVVNTLGVHVGSMALIPDVDPVEVVCGHEVGQLSFLWVLWGFVLQYK